MAGQGTGSGFFWVRRLHSLAGLLLAFAYFVCFLLPYSAAIGGAQAFNRVAAFQDGFPFAGFLRILFVAAPLLLHAAVGLAIVYGSQVNVVAYGFYRNWMTALERLTGILMLPFVGVHVVKTQLAFALTDRYADFAYLQKLLAPSWMRALYAVGVVCAAFHIGNGIAGALARWGITRSRKAEDAASMVMWVVTIVLAAWGVRIVLAF